MKVKKPMDSEASNDSIYCQKLTNAEFAQIQDYIQKNCGIRLPVTKKNMVEGRLRRRLKTLGMGSYSDYLSMVFEGEDHLAEREKLSLIDVITTNKTDFFREPKHFSYMNDVLLPQLEAEGAGTKRCLNVWSSACSTGEEPYTIAMVLAEYFGVDGNFRIFASDISYSVLERAINAVYTEEKAQDIPLGLKKKYLMRSKSGNGLVRFKPEIREKVTFGRLNLMDNNYNLPVMMDMTFCRNVIIYFDTETQQNIINKICRYIMPGGNLFLGHSESVHGMNLPLEVIVPTIFRRK
ncbi:CheR family methyltransferase [Seleniivibrio woodruffii]|uniref:CheR family methyltransferase n=1 Tax=Seleniivibrio woodruffii TaxID=1078050 RepID=UPI00240A4B09|nr:CheR family methyltransferase [Seleniivibrio woodruffii]